jgi:hypothetical protein
VSESAWTADDPQPGDFDAETSTIDPRYVESHHGSPDAKLKILLSFEGEDAERLERSADARGKKPPARSSQTFYATPTAQRHRNCRSSTLSACASGGVPRSRGGTPAGDETHVSLAGHPRTPAHATGAAAPARAARTPRRLP